MYTVFAAKSVWLPVGWVLLAVFAALGLLALASPRLFERVANTGGRWIDSNRLLAVLDKSYDLDRRVLPFSRVLGALVLVSVGVLGWLLSRL